MKYLLNICVPVSMGYDVEEKRYSPYPHGAYSLVRETNMNQIIYKQM